MKTFISWSGEASHAAAIALRQYLPIMVPGLEAFMSEHDIGSGQRWAARLAAALSDARFSIICLTPDNLRSDWVLFEAGALAKHLDGGVCGLLFDGLTPSNITGPLSQFQHRLFERAAVRTLIADLAALTNQTVAADQLDIAFNALWKELQAKCTVVQSKSMPQRRSSEDLLTEILTRMRSVETEVERMRPSGRKRANLSTLANASLVRTVDNRFVFVRLEQFSSEDTADAAIEVRSKTSVSAFLNLVWSVIPFETRPEPYTFGRDWALFDAVVGKRLRDLETPWARGDAEPDETDDRTLRQTSVRPGAVLVTRRIREAVEEEGSGS